MRRLAYLFPTFPVLHQTFTLGEVLGLKRRGYDLRLISIRNSASGAQQPEAVSLVADTDYCPPLFSRAMARVAAFVPSRRRSDDGGESTMGLKERLRGVYHCNAVVYLVKSWSMIPYAIYVAELLKREGIEHLHAHWASYPATVAYLVKRWAGIPYSFTAHAYDIHMVQRMLPAKLEEAEFVVTCAHANRHLLAGLCGTSAVDRIYVNYHGTDLDRFRPGDHRQDGRATVVTCGSLEEYKGFHYLLDAVALLRRRGTEIACELVGDGPQRALLEERATAAGIGDLVTFHGFVDQGRLAEIYRTARVFAMPSITLGRYGKQDVIPNVLAEAMAVGLPVVGTDIAGIPELIEDRVSGLLVPQRDASALADALASLLADPAWAARLADAGRTKVRKIWDRERNLEELAEILNTYVAETAPAAEAA
jgi:colanic acid/amylovoran biosynthesis glycosyltransferase